MVTASRARRPRVLLVSWLFPPHNSIGAKRAYRFARALPALGWDATVLCASRPPARYIDPTPWSVPPQVMVVPEYDPPWLTRIANWLDARADQRAKPTAGDDAVQSNAQWRQRIARLAHDATPTESIAVHLSHAIARALALHRQTPFDAVWTTSYPYSAHLIGRALHRRLGIEFVADLRDPWTLNFVHDQKLAPARAVENALERSVFAAAARIVVTTESLATAYQSKYPEWAARFRTIRNGFERIELPPREPPHRPLRLVHFGHVYGERTLNPVYRALAELVADGTLSCSDFELENLGRISDHDLARIDALGLRTAVRVRPPLPYIEGLARLRSAHVALLPTWGTDRGPLFLPGKLYDYLLAGVPILATGRNPELAAILSETRAGVLFADDDIAGIRTHLARFASDAPQTGPHFDAVDRYSSDHASRQFAELLDELLAHTGSVARHSSPDVQH